MGGRPIQLNEAFFMADEEPTWQDLLSNSYKNELEIATSLHDLLDETGMFGNVLYGLPENIQKVYKADIATVFVNGDDFRQTQGGRNRPDFVYTTIGIIVRGTEGNPHLRLNEKKIYLTSRFDDKSNADSGTWLTLDGCVRNTEIIEKASLYPERNKSNFLTTAVIQLKHDVRF